MTFVERRAMQSALSRFAKPGTGLDVGCEGGRWSRLLNNLGWQMTATDIDPHTLELCRQRNPSVNCLLVQEQDETFPVATESIDLLVTIQVPVVDCDWFPDEAKRVLKPSGVLVGSFNNLISWRGLAANIKSTIAKHPCYYPKPYAVFRRSLRNQGFSIDYEQGYCWGPFGRHSNSKWISPATKLERSLQVNRLVSLSPWVAYVASRH
jgi:SAM-dependent methyltransferase